MSGKPWIYSSKIHSTEFGKPVAMENMSYRDFQIFLLIYNSKHSPKISILKP